MLVVQRFFRAKRTNLHEKYDYPIIETEFREESLLIAQRLLQHVADKGGRFQS